MGMLWRMFWDFVSFVDIVVSCVLHTVYGIHMMASAMWMDFMSSSTSSAAQESGRISPVVEADERETDNRARSKGVTLATGADGHNLGYAGSFMEGHEKAPIVLVHGCFGFGEHVSHRSSLHHPVSNDGLAM
jgi:hypothetical protein